MRRMRKPEAAEYLGVSVSTLNGMMKKRCIDYYKGESPRSLVFFDQADLDRYIDETKRTRIIQRERLNAYQTYRKRRVSA